MNKRKKILGLMLVAVFVLSLVGVRFGPSIVEAWDKVKYEIYQLYVYKINGVSGYSLTITAPVIVGISDMSGASVYQPKPSTAILSGATGTIAWSASGTGGASGWHITATHLDTYKEFYVENSFPYSTLAGATIFSDKCPSGANKTGNTIYLPSVTADLDGKEFKFINTLGTTPFVLYNANSRFRFGGATGSTPFSQLTVVQSGATTIPDSIGESITIKAIYTPTTVSGWYVSSKMIEW